MLAIDSRWEGLEQKNGQIGGKTVFPGFSPPIFFQSCLEKKTNPEKREETLFSPQFFCFFIPGFPISPIDKTKASNSPTYTPLKKTQLQTRKLFRVFFKKKKSVCHLSLELRFKPTCWLCLPLSGRTLSQGTCPSVPHGHRPRKHGSGPRRRGNSVDGLRELQAGLMPQFSLPI